MSFSRDNPICCKNSDVPPLGVLYYLNTSTFFASCSVLDPTRYSDVPQVICTTSWVCHTQKLRKSDIRHSTASKQAQQASTASKAGHTASKQQQHLSSRHFLIKKVYELLGDIYTDGRYRIHTAV